MPDSDQTIAEQIERTTRKLIGRPYLDSPLGEGFGPDPDPRYRLDAFDCTTFVETAVALSWATSPDEAPRLLDKIRYTGGSISFQTRRHLVTSQWIPDLIEDGVFRDITRKVGRQHVRTVRLRLTKGRWTQRRIARRLELPADAVPTGVFVLPYIPLQNVRQVSKRIPNGSIVNLVRVSWHLSPEVVTHQAFVFRTHHNRLVVRHASPIAKRVINEPFPRVLARYQKPRKWPILGLNLLVATKPKETWFH